MASMSAILGGHYLGKRGRLDALLLGWEYFWLLMITRKLPRQGGNSKVECLFDLPCPHARVCDRLLHSGRLTPVAGPSIFLIL